MLLAFPCPSSTTTQALPLLAPGRGLTCLQLPSLERSRLNLLSALSPSPARVPSNLVGAQYINTPPPHTHTVAPFKSLVRLQARPRRQPRASVPLDAVSPSWHQGYTWEKLIDAKKIPIALGLEKSIKCIQRCMSTLKSWSHNMNWKKQKRCNVNSDLHYIKCVRMDFLLFSTSFVNVLAVN